MEESQRNSTDDNVKTAVVQSPIIMKIDGPEETNDKESEENDKNTETLKADEFKMCSPTFRPTLPLSNNPFASPQNKISKGILKPAQFNIKTNNTTSTPFVLKPSQLNPFKNSSDKTNSEKSDNSDTRVNGDMPKFVPLVVPEKSTQKVTETKPQPVETKISSNSFVFGQNLKERVAETENKEESKASTSLGANGTSEMLFSSAIKSELKADPTDSSKEKEMKSLSESAKEYEESRANKRKYEEVEVITGEENEINILSISCKLFSFNKSSSNWLELGRGTLRLNDLNGYNFVKNCALGSRLVFRTSGSLRVLLNTKIWAEMVVEKANEKSIRVTALDASGEIKVFLLMSNIEDSNRLYSHLQTRLEREIAAQKRKKTEPSSDSPTKTD
ncbi:ran-binding protein 3 [Diabrotica virgifera virgifera]|uniref:Ran-binding protein 3 n=1 Tax=Diabrotica virgifera virgifera TaxID=50390 RepID=A0A6P7FZA5_DIAVI|nr:ran-binding protein 3 [Diabrotica virgifera virgifera]